MPTTKDSSDLSAIVPRLRKRLAAADGPVALRELGREIFFAPTAAPELILKLLKPFLTQIPEAVVLEDNHISWTGAPLQVGHPLAGSRFVVVDLETTGVASRGARMTEIAMYAVENGGITDEFTSLVNPLQPVPPFITSLTGITNDMVRNAPPFPRLAPKVRNFIGDSVVVAHNARFDTGFLEFEFNQADPLFQFANPSLCTVHLSRHLVPGLDNYRLDTVADHFGVGIRARHRAAGDALATARVFLRLLDLLAERSITTVEAAQKLRRPRKRSSNVKDDRP